MLYIVFELTAHKPRHCLTLSFSNRMFLCLNERHHAKSNLSICHHAKIDLDDRPRAYMSPYPLNQKAVKDNGIKLI